MSAATMANFDWLRRVGATSQVVAVLNDQPYLFVTLIVVVIGLASQCIFLWFIHFATRKPEQKRRKMKKPKTQAKGAATSKT